MENVFLPIPVDIILSRLGEEGVGDTGYPLLGPFRLNNIDPSYVLLERILILDAGSD